MESMRMSNINVKSRVREILVLLVLMTAAIVYSVVTAEETNIPTKQEIKK